MWGLGGRGVCSPVFAADRLVGAVSEETNIPPNSTPLRLSFIGYSWLGSLKFVCYEVSLWTGIKLRWG